MLGLIRYVTFPFMTIKNLTILYNALVQSKLEYASVLELHYID
jgi:hypothetical protein